MKKVLFLMFLLFLMGLGAANVNAQVRIGGNAAPNAAAVLDLNADDINSGTKGLALPRVSLASTTDLLSNMTLLTGMLVYNTNEAMTNGQGTGVYAWDGSKWLVVAGEVGTAGTVTGSADSYPTWCFPAYTKLGCWMTGNSKEGSFVADSYCTWCPGSGRYYTLPQAPLACPPGWVLPSMIQWDALYSYLRSGKATASEIRPWYSSPLFQGTWNGTALYDVGFAARIWASNGFYKFINGALDQDVADSHIPPAEYALSVRCVRQ